MCLIVFLLYNICKVLCIYCDVIRICHINTVHDNHICISQTQNVLFTCIYNTYVYKSMYTIQHVCYAACMLRSM